jgi:hypothetical protein
VRAHGHSTGSYGKKGPKEGGQVAASRHFAISATGTLKYKGREQRNENSRWENPRNTLRFIVTIHIKSNPAIDCGLAVLAFRLPGV